MVIDYKDKWVQIGSRSAYRVVVRQDFLPVAEFGSRAAAERHGDKLWNQRPLSDRLAERLYVGRD